MNTRLILATGVLAWAVALAEDAPFAPPAYFEVPYPDGFRQWTHVASAVVSTPMVKTATDAEKEKTPAAHGLIHNLYANELAVAGYRTGQFPEGAVLIADWFFLEETRGGLKQGRRKSVDVMVRDARYAETGGWGFENFEQGSRTQRNVGPKAAKSCFECHRRAGEEHQFVFSTLQP